MDYTKYEHKLPYFPRRENLEGYIAWFNEDRAIYEMFKQDLFNELGITDNPKREKLFSVVWENGHAYGYSEVFNKSLDLVELID